VSLLVHELLTLLDHMSYSILSFTCMFCRSLFVLFRLAIVLSVLLQYTDSEYSFGISKLFLLDKNTIFIYVSKLSLPPNRITFMLLR